MLVAPVGYCSAWWWCCGSHENVRECLELKKAEDIAFVNRYQMLAVETAVLRRARRLFANKAQV